MSRDYAKSRTSKSAKPPAKKSDKRPSKKNDGPNAAPAWLWLFVGIGLGLFIAFLYSLISSGQSLPASTPHTPATNDPVVAEKKAPVFEFYQTLPRAKLQPSTSPPSPENQAQEYAYLLQVGSFRHANDAEARKAELAFLGINSEINSATVDGIHWNRVQIGPIATRGESENVRGQLLEAGYTVQTSRRPIKTK